MTIREAIYFENIPEVKRILEDKPELIDEKDEKGVLMALLAAKTGNLKLVRYIVEYSRASMNITDDNHKNMLHYAAMSGNVDTCRYLVEKVGISPLSGDIYLLTPYEIARQNKFFELEDYFKEVTGASLENMYHNPIRTGMYPDPSIVRVDDTYYMVNSTFIYFPCIPVSMSKDLIHWKIIGIDPSIFNDDDGRRYMLLNRGARIFELNEDATKQISEAALLYYGDNKRASEGPHLLKKDGYYYLFQAEGGTGPGHRITVSRSKTLMGNYEPCPYNPIMRQNDESAIIQRCGHGKPVQTQNGDWYMVYLCGRKIGDGYSMLGRETALDPVSWTADGWPVVNNLDGPSVLQIKPALPETIWESHMDDDFEEDYLSTDWMFPRTPEADGVFLKDSRVYIKGSTYNLNSMHAKNILLRRQQDFKFTVEAKMDMPQLYPGQDAGLTCYYDENTFLKFGIYATLTNPVRLVAKLEEYIGDDIITSDEFEIDYNQKDIYFKIETDYLKRKFYISYDNKTFYQIAARDNVYYLCDEGLKKGKRFTGAMIGMYAYAGDWAEKYTDEYGNHGTDILYAAFDYFRYKPS